MRKKSKKVYGVGVNDVDYNVYRYEKFKGKLKIVWRCPYYRVWVDVLKRCYDEAYIRKNPTYAGCTIYEDWVYFSNFKSWMEKQDHEGKQLDKDILVEGNKLYSPETCRFVDAKVNSFLTDSGAKRGCWPLGVSWNKWNRKFQAKCNNPFNGSQGYLGYFACPKEAHKAWQAKKHEYACQLADLQEDPIVAQALRERYAPDKDWIKV
jgi:hypothetical protein